MKHRVPRPSILVPVLAAALCALPAAAQNVCDGVSQVKNSDLTRVAVVTGLTAGRSGPLFITAPPGDVGRIFIVMQNGVIRQLPRGAAPGSSTVFLDIVARVLSTSDEQGLLGLAFSPNFATNGIFYVDYVRADGHTIISKFRTMDGTANTVGDPASETVLLRIADTETNHQGGWMSFGPDGFLYIAQGDGGGGGDQHGTCGNGQSLKALLGKILRIDPTGTVGTQPDCGLDAGPYTIPPGNPFADGAATGNCDEIWLYGLRNPWRDSFDTANGDLYIGDVGQGCWEEVNRVPAGGSGDNFGWRMFEGRHCYNATQGCLATNSPAGCTPACSDPAPAGDAIPNGTTVPIWEYNSNTGTNCSVVGGYVYRGCRMPDFRGTYFYGDYCTGSVLSFDPSGGTPTNPRTWTTQLGSGLAFGLTSFGTDARGELYYADRDGIVYAVVPPLPDFEVSGVGAADQLLLSKTGDWTWENLTTSSWQPVSAYRVYRADVADGVFNAGEIFNCVRTAAATSWPSGGDLANPAPGGMFAYVVTALNAGGQQTSPGGSPVRTLGAAACP
jgi:glucose/arabinose dehydrogenase